MTSIRIKNKNYKKKELKKKRKKKKKGEDGRSLTLKIQALFINTHFRNLGPLIN